MSTFDESSLQKIRDDLEKAKRECSSVGERMRKDLADIQNKIADIRHDLSNLSDTTKEIYLLEHPVGSIVMNTSGINPEIMYGGKWEQFAQGRTFIGVDEKEEAFKDSNLTGGTESESHTHTGFEHTHFAVGHKHKIPAHKHRLPYIHAHKQSHYHTFYHTHICTHDHIWIHYHIQDFGWNGEYYTYLNIPMNGHEVVDSIPSEYAELNSANATQTTKSIQNYTSSSYTRIDGEENNVIFSNTEKCGIADNHLTDNNEDLTSYENAEVEENAEGYTSETKIVLGGSEDTIPKADYEKVQPYITCYYYKRIE